MHSFGRGQQSVLAEGPLRLGSPREVAGRMLAQGLRCFSSSGHAAAGSHRFPCTCAVRRTGILVSTRGVRARETANGHRPRECRGAVNRRLSPSGLASFTQISLYKEEALFSCWRWKTHIVRFTVNIKTNHDNKTGLLGLAVRCHLLKVPSCLF